MIKLDKRLSAVARLVREGSAVADIGSDHALLPVYLRQNGWTDIIASDINSGPLDFARKTLQKYGAEDIKLVLSDGFENIPPRDDVIIAGMGGEQILEIIQQRKCGKTRYILQPMTKHEVLRSGLYQSGFEIISEKAVRDGNKIYIIIHAEFTGKNREISEDEAFFGFSGDLDYIEKRKEKLNKMRRRKT